MKTLHPNAALLIILTVTAFLSCGKNNTGNTQVKSSAKLITSFAISNLNPAAIGTINQNNLSIADTVPNGTDLKTLTPTITISADASITPASGVVADFTKPQSYTVTAGDGSSQTYTVTVSVAPTKSVVIDCTNFSNLPTEWKDQGSGIDYVVGCPITLKSGTTTIDPGVRIQFEGKDAGFIVSYTAGLKMIGTADKPIILAGKDSIPGSWAGVVISSGNVMDNQWEYVTLSSAGGSTNSAGLFLDNSNMEGMRVSLKNCTFNNNLGYGLWDLDNGYSYTASLFTAFANNLFTNNTRSAVKIKMTEIGSLDGTSSYINNGQKYIEVSSRNLLLCNTVINKIDASYDILNLISLDQKVSINPGVTLTFAKDAGLYIAYNSSDGSFIANGTASDPIKFEGDGAAITQGYWAGIELDNADPNISFDHCIIDGAGSYLSTSNCASNKKTAINFGGRCGGSNIINYGGGKVANSTISNSGGYGISLIKGHPVVLTNNTYLNNVASDTLSYQ